MKVYVAYRTDPEGYGQRLADGSMSRLKAALRQVPESAWSIFIYDIKATVQVVCDLIQDPASIVNIQAAAGPDNIRVNEQGQVRK